MIFDLLADPSRHSEIDGSGTVRASSDSSPKRLTLGSKFGMKMKLGVPYDIRNTVVEFEEGALLAWAHFGGHRWRYELAPEGNSTVVTETFDWSTSRLPIFIELMSYPKRNLAAMHKTLERLDEVVTG